jgi:hypothetical protein
LIFLIAFSFASFAVSLVAVAYNRSLVAERPDETRIHVHVAMDGCLGIWNAGASVACMLMSEQECVRGGAWSGTLLLFVPLRLGLAGMNIEYVAALRAALQLPFSVGALGGRPNAAHYFVGTEGV